MNFPGKGFIDFLLCASVNFLIPEHENGQRVIFPSFSWISFFELDFELFEQN